MKRKLEFLLLILLVLSPAALAAITLGQASASESLKSKVEVLEDSKRDDSNPCLPAAALGIPCTFIKTDSVLITLPPPKGQLTTVTGRTTPDGGDGVP
jgi:hypothetical protein